MVSCEENVESWDTLTDEEQNNIRNRSSSKCKSQMASEVATYKKDTRVKLLEMNRRRYWKIETSKKDSDKVLSYIYVWKRVGESIYFLHKKDGDDRHTFIKMTVDFNEKMINDLLETHCEDQKTDELLVSLGSKSSSILITDKPYSSPPDYYRLDTTYKTDIKYPVFFAKYLYEQKKKKLKESGSNTVTSTETFTAKVTATDDDADLPASYSSYSNAEFCVVNFRTDNETDETNEIDVTYDNGFDFVCTTSASGPTNPVPAETDMNFVPSTEL